MAIVAVPTVGTGNPLVAALVAEVVADMSSDGFDPLTQAVAVEVPGDSDGQKRNNADDIRSAVRATLLRTGVTPPPGLTLRLKRKDATVTFYYGTATEKTDAAHIGAEVPAA